MASSAPTYNVQTNSPATNQFSESCLKGNEEEVRSLLSSGSDPNETNDVSKFTPLHFVAMEGHKEILDLLIEAGANLDSRIDSGWTPLFHAVANGHYDIVKCLVEKGANVNTKCKLGQSVLDISEYFTPVAAADEKSRTKHTNITNYLMNTGKIIHTDES